MAHDITNILNLYSCRCLFVLLWKSMLSLKAWCHFVFEFSKCWFWFLGWISECLEIIIIEVLKFRIIQLSTSRVYSRSECWWRFLFDPPHFLWLFAIPKVVFSIGTEIVEFLIEVINLLVRKAESWPIY